MAELYGKSRAATAVPAYYFPSVASLAIRAAAWLASSPKWTCRKCRSYMPRIRALFLSVFPSILTLKLMQDEQRIEIKLSSGMDSMTNSGFFMLHSFPIALWKFSLRTWGRPSIFGTGGKHETTHFL